MESSGLRISSLTVTVDGKREREREAWAWAWTVQSLIRTEQRNTNKDFNLLLIDVRNKRNQVNYIHVSWTIWITRQETITGTPRSGKTNLQDLATTKVFPFQNEINIALLLSIEYMAWTRDRPSEVYSVVGWHSNKCSLVTDLDAKLTVH